MFENLSPAVISRFKRGGQYTVLLKPSFHGARTAKILSNLHLDEIGGLINLRPPWSDPVTSLSRTQVIARHYLLKLEPISTKLP